MLLYVFLLLALESVIGQKQSFRGGNPYSPVPYYNLGQKPGNGVGVLQDLSNARILSNEPFIISFEFPKLIGSGDSRKSRIGTKRSKTQRKKNRKPRHFRKIIVPKEDVLERRNRLEMMRRPPGLPDLRAPHLIAEDRRTGKSLLNTADSWNPSDRRSYGRVMNFDGEERETTDKENEPTIQAMNPLEKITGPEEGGDEEERESVRKENWEDIKKKWASLFGKVNEGSENNEMNENEERIKALSKKRWANCQLLKILKASQRNPYFYKLLPPDYPAVIMNEEKQLQCNEFYDIIDLAKDKKMIEDKIQQLEWMLSSGNDSETRRKREAPEEVKEKSEEETTLQDESLHGKTEGEVRSDRSKRTKERQHIRRQRSKGSQEKVRRVRRPVKTKESRRLKSDKQETEEKDNGKRSRRKDNANEVSTRKILEEDELKPDEETAEKKREKQEIRTGKDISLQDIFSPSEVNKVIRQKEMEANIFGTVLKAMRKFEDNNPYDESFRPQKRESGNSTGNALIPKNDIDEEGWELEDTIKKLAKIFKVLDVKVRAKKVCTDCKDSEESSSESSEDGKALRKGKVGKTPKCTCAECPFCQNCLQCFKECRKAALAAKNALNQTPASPTAKGVTGEKDIPLSSDKNGRDRESKIPAEENAVVGERSNNVKLERMYRSKLPPSRDLVRVYFDNPENKLLVWTKRGRRTMPWGPLTSDLQLYRDRARQILKSAEDILHRIRETEEKLHTGQYEEDEQGETSEKTQKMKDMDEIIKKVVNEDDTKYILRTPWEVELEKGIVDGNVLQSNQDSKNFEGTAFNIFKDGLQDEMELPKESLTLAKFKDDEEVKASSAGRESRESYEVGRVEAADPKPETERKMDGMKSSNDEVKSVQVQATSSREVEGESVEAAVLPIEQKGKMDHAGHQKDAAHTEESKHNADDWREKEEEDTPAKVVAVNQEKPTDEVSSKVKSNAYADPEAQRKMVVEYMKKKYGKVEDNQKANSESEEEEKDITYAVENTKLAQSDEMQSVGKTNVAEPSSEKKSYSEESGTEEAYSGESEDAERPSSGESQEVEKSHSEESSVEKAYNGESSSVEESEKGGKQVSSGESENVKKPFSSDPGQEGRENNDSSEHVERPLSRDSIQVRLEHSDESEHVERPWSGESVQIGSQRSESGESEEMEKALSDESEKSEKVEKARGYSDESNEMEESAEQTVEESKEVNTGEIVKFPLNKESDDAGIVEKNAENVMRREYEKEESEEDPISYEDEEVERKDANTAEEMEDTTEDIEETPFGRVQIPQMEDAERESHEEKSPFDDHIKSIEETYIIKGVKQTKEEKEAILKALLNVEKEENRLEEEVLGNTENIVESTKGKGNGEEVKMPEIPVEKEKHSLKTVVQHLEKGHMDENDFDLIKKLDDSQVDLLVGEMQKNDEKGVPVNCETRMKLCQAVCSCRNNGTEPELNKYEIIKEFLGWLKDLDINKMEPISA